MKTLLFPLKGSTVRRYWTTSYSRRLGALFASGTLISTLAIIVIGVRFSLQPSPAVIVSEPTEEELALQFLLHPVETEAALRRDPEYVKEVAIASLEFANPTLVYQERLKDPEFARSVERSTRSILNPTKTVDALANDPEFLTREN